MDRFEKHAEYIMKRGDKIIAERERKSKMIKRISLSGAGVMAAAIVGIFAMKTAPLPYESRLPDTGTTSSVSTAISENTVKSDIITDTSSPQSSIVSAVSSMVTVPTTAAEPRLSQEAVVSSAAETVQIEYTSTEVHTSVQKAAETTSSKVPDGDTTETTTDSESAALPDNPDPPIPWAERELSRKYILAEFGTPTNYYVPANKTVSAEDTGEFLSDIYMSGYDDETDTNHHCIAKAYYINGYSENEMIAIRFEESDEYYVYDHT